MLRRILTWSPVLRTNTLTWLPVRARETAEVCTSAPAARTGTVAVGAIRTMRSLLPFDVVSHSAPSGPCTTVRMRPSPSACGRSLGLGVRHGEDPGPPHLHLVEQRQGVVGRHQLQSGAGPDGLERAEDRGVPDRVRNRTDVQLWVARAVDLTARAGVATAAGVLGRGARVRPCVPGLPAEELVHALEQRRHRDAGGGDQQGNDQVVLLGQVRVEHHAERPSRRGRPQQVSRLGHLAHQTGDDRVLAEHRVDQQPSLHRRLRGRVHRPLLGQRVRDQLGLAPVHEIPAGSLCRSGVVLRGGLEQGLDAQPQRTGHLGVVLLDRLRGGRVGLARGDDEFGHVLVSFEGAMWWFHRYFITVVSVENNPPPTPHPAAPGYGPRPGTGRSSQALSRSRAALLETLRTQTQPTTLAALAAASGLHANTVGEHLHALVRSGLVRRHPEAPEGRGRPAWLYEATGRDAATNPEYAGLASALAAAIHMTSTSPTDDAVTAGRAWGHEMARERGAGPASSAVAARREVVGLLDEMGFAPQADPRSTVVALTRCPLLEAAHKYPDIVCGVHLGLVRGALEEYGADPDGTELAAVRRAGCLPAALGAAA